MKIKTQTTKWSSVSDEDLTALKRYKSDFPDIKGQWLPIIKPTILIEEKQFI